MKIGILLCGNRDLDSNELSTLTTLKLDLSSRMPEFNTHLSWLESLDNNIQTGINHLLKLGLEHIIILPVMLVMSASKKEKIEEIMGSFFVNYNPNNIKLELSSITEVDSDILLAAEKSIVEAESTAINAVSRDQSTLILIGEGSDEARINANAYKMCRMIWEGMGFAWGEACYLEDASPNLRSSLRRVSQIGYKRAIIFPYFLYGGSYISMIHEEIKIKREGPIDIDYVIAKPINAYREVVNSLERRIKEIIRHNGNMNCMECGYREQVLEEAIEKSENEKHDHLPH